MAGKMVDGPYAAEAKACTSNPHRSTTSLALHFRKTSPTNSFDVGVGLSGKCQGELKVSVRARCCSAITLRDILYSLIRIH
jgi:hypothetical protein